MRLFSSFAVFLALASPAAAFQSSNGFFVSPVDAQSFEVHYRPFQNVTNYWCGAGEYVIDVLHMPATTRVYRASPEPRKQASGIVFTLNPANAAPGAGIKNFGSGVKDGSVAAGHASGAFCDVFDTFPFF